MTTNTPETPEVAARRLCARWIEQGYKLAALHAYRDATGAAKFYRVRLTHPHRAKEIRPMHFNGRAFALGEPAAPATGKPLYRLPELLADDGPVYVVEGEACADALAALGIIATTSGSAASADAADWSPLRGRDVAIWRDNDKAGEGHARAVTAKLRGIAASVEWIDLAPLALPEHGDCVDWLAHHPDATADAVHALARVPAPDPSPPPTPPAGAAPEPLRRPSVAPPPYPLDALGDCLGAAAERLHSVLQCPAALCGQSVLAAASLATQAHADVEIDGRCEPLSLWHVSVAESGERKSAADHWALRAHREQERDAADEHRQAQTTYTIAASAHKAAMSKAEKKADAAAIRAAMADAGDPPEPPLSPLLLSEPTLEGLHKLYQHGRPSLGLFNDDAGDFLGGHAMNRDNRTKSAAGFSRLWDCGEFSRVRSGDGAAKFYGRRLALHVMLQPVIAEKVLSDDVLTGQGFLARCLLSWPESTIGSRRYVEHDLSTDPAMLAYWDRMRFLLRLSPRLRADTRNELDPRTLPLSPDAKRRWIAVADAIERDMADEYAEVKAWASKTAAQVLRIAGVLTLIDNDEAETIAAGAIDRAARLVEYHLAEAARIVGTARVPSHLRNAERLLEWCRRSGRSLLYSADALRNGPAAIRDADTFRAAVETLEGHAWADRIEGGEVIDGTRRALVWRLRTEEVG
jgi:hypothetical protein